MTATITPPSSTLPDRPEMITLEGVSWELYELLLHDTEGQHLRITYDQGRMVIMSPSLRHDRVKKWVGRLIEAASDELDIPIGSCGSATWKRKDLDKGLEPDECYYIQNEPVMRGRLEVDFEIDPPPDLAVEVDITHHPVNRPSIYAALGVGEIWRYDGSGIEFHIRDHSTYLSIARSRAFPQLTSEDVLRFLNKFTILSETAVIREFRKWVRTIR